MENEDEDEDDEDEDEDEDDDDGGVKLRLEAAAADADAFDTFVSATKGVLETGVGLTFSKKLKSFKSGNNI